MKNGVNQIILASRKVLSKRVYLIFFLLLIPIIAFLLFLIPVKYISGNSIDFQVSLFQISDYLVLILLSMLESLLLVMFFYLFALTKRKAHLKTAGQGSIGLFSVVPAFLFGTKLCPMCLAGIFGAFGFSTGLISPLLLNRQWVFIASIGILLISLYFISNKVNGFCEQCIKQK